MNDAVVPHEGERQQHLACKPTDQSGCKAYKSVCLDELIEIDAEKFHSNAEVISEVEVFGHFDHVMFFIRILRNINLGHLERDKKAYPSPQIVKNLDLN